MNNYQIRSAFRVKSREAAHARATNNLTGSYPTPIGVCTQITDSAPLTACPFGPPLPWPISTTAPDRKSSSRIDTLCHFCDYS